jgi:hypothetical protein
MGLSVSRVICIEDDILSIRKYQNYAAKWEVLNFLKKIPKGTHYKVIYTLDDQGPIMVVKKKIMILINIRTKEDMGACFLPRSWNGRRVRRSVITPIYETT